MSGRSALPVEFVSETRAVVFVLGYAPPRISARRGVCCAVTRRLLEIDGVTAWRVRPEFRSSGGAIIAKLFVAGPCWSRSSPAWWCRALGRGGPWWNLLMVARTLQLLLAYQSARGGWGRRVGRRAAAVPGSRRSNSRRRPTTRTAAGAAGDAMEVICIHARQDRISRPDPSSLPRSLVFGAKVRTSLPLVRAETLIPAAAVGFRGAALHSSGGRVPNQLRQTRLTRCCLASAQPRRRGFDRVGDQGLNNGGPPPTRPCAKGSGSEQSVAATAPLVA